MVLLTVLSFLIAALAGFMLWRNVHSEPRSMWLGTWTIVFLMFLISTIMLAASFVGGPGLLIIMAIMMVVIGIFVIMSVLIDLGVVYYSW